MNAPIVNINKNGTRKKNEKNEFTNLLVSAEWKWLKLLKRVYIFYLESFTVNQTIT